MWHISIGKVAIRKGFKDVWHTFGKGAIRKGFINVWHTSIGKGAIRWPVTGSDPALTVRAQSCPRAQTGFGLSRSVNSDARGRVTL